jgi:hypothetical protein
MAASWMDIGPWLRAHGLSWPWFFGRFFELNFGVQIGRKKFKSRSLDLNLV